MDPAPEPLPEKRRPFLRCCKWTCRLLVWTLLLIAGLLAYLMVVGFPEPAMERIRALVRKNGFSLEAESLRLHPRDGLVAVGCVLGSAEHPSIRFSVKRLSVLIEPRELFTSSRGFQGFRMENGTFTGDMGELLGDASRHHDLDIENIHTTVRLVPDGVSLERFRARSLDLQFNGVGALHMGKGWPWVQTPKPPRPPGPVRPDTPDGPEGTNEKRDLLFEMLEEFDAVEFSGRPSINVKFNVDYRNPANNTLDLSARSDQDLVIREVPFKHLNLDLTLDGNTLRVSHFDARSGVTMLKAKGEFDGDSQVVTGGVQSSLPLADLRRFMPGSVREEIDRKQLAIEGDWNIDLQFDGVPVKQAGRHYTAAITANRATYRGLWWERGSMKLIQEGKKLTLTDMDLVVGEGGAQGPFTGEVVMDYSNRTYRADVQLGCKPSAIRSLWKEGSGTRKIIDRFTFTKACPSVFLKVSGEPDYPERFKLALDFDGSDLSYRAPGMEEAVELDALAARITATNEVLRLDELRIERPEGEITGWIQNDFRAKAADLDVISTISPEAMTGLIGPGARRMIKPFAFDGQAMIQATGRIDYGENRSHNVSGALFVEDAGSGWVYAEDCYFYWQAVGNAVTFADIRGVADQGDFNGTLFLQNLDTRTNTTYMLNAQLNGADLEAVTRRKFKPGKEPWAGYLTSRFRLEGRLGEGFGPSLRGEGTLNIDESRLFKIPLFGGLSKGLSRLVPGFGYASQTDFESQFKIREEYMGFSDAKLRGDLLSMSGDGKVYFDKRVSAKMQIQLLKKGLVAELIQKLSWPVSKLLEVKLTGTLDEPDWRPDNLPKELFLKFD